MEEQTINNEKISEIISSDEKILWKGRRNEKILNFYLFAGLVLSILIAGFFFSQGQVEHHLGSGSLTSGKSIAGLSILIGFVVSFAIYYNKLASQYVITDKKVIVHFGLVSDTLQYAYHENIRHMHIRKRFIGTLLNVGTVYVDSGKHTDSKMHFREIRGLNMNPPSSRIVYYALKDVENPQKVYNLIARLIEKAHEPKPGESINEKIKEASEKEE